MLPQKICESCGIHLQFIHNIRRQCILTDFSLRKTLNTNSLLENLTEDQKTSMNANFEVEVVTNSEFLFVDPDNESENIDSSSTDRDDSCNAPVSVISIDDDSKPLTKYKCNDCSKEFNDQNILRQHMRLSHNEFKCDVCNKYFSQYQTLARHIKIHQMNSRTKLCQYCEKTFFRSDDLKRHIRTHTNERPYKYVLVLKLVIVIF